MRKIIERTGLSYDKDGFLNGFFKGSVGASAFIALAVLFTGCFGG